LLDPYATHIDELIRSTPKITAVRVGSYLRQNVDTELNVDERTLRQYVAARRAVLVPRIVSRGVVYERHSTRVGLLAGNDR
jgi:hypothetical protein